MESRTPPTPHLYDTHTPARTRAMVAVDTWRRAPTEPHRREAVAALNELDPTETTSED